MGYRGMGVGWEMGKINRWRRKQEDTISGVRDRRRRGKGPAGPNILRNVLSAAEQDGHDQRMGKPDFDTVHDPIARTLEDREVVMEPRVVEDSLEVGHSSTSSRKDRDDA